MIPGRPNTERPPSTITRDPRCDAASIEFGCFEGLDARLIVHDRQPRNSVILAEYCRRSRSQQHKLQPLASWKRLSWLARSNTTALRKPATSSDAFPADRGNI